MIWLAFLPALLPPLLACWLHGYRLGGARTAQALWEPVVAAEPEPPASPDDWFAA